MFALRLALSLGKTLGEVAAMPSAEFTLWQAYEAREPFGPLVDDYRAGTICATSINHRLKKGAKPLSAADFMPALSRALHPPEPKPEGPPPKLTAEQEAAFLDAMFGFQ